MNQNLLIRLKKVEAKANVNKSQGAVVVADLSELTPEERAIALAIGHGTTGKDGGSVSVEQLEMLKSEELAVVRKLVEATATKAYQNQHEPHN